MISHHKSKLAISQNIGQANARGSSGLTDGVRLQWDLSKSPSKDISIFEVTKTNFTSYPKKFSIKKNPEGIPLFDAWLEEKSVLFEEKKKKIFPENEDWATR